MLRNYQRLMCCGLCTVNEVRSEAWQTERRHHGREKTRRVHRIAVGFRAQSALDSLKTENLAMYLSERCGRRKIIC